MLKNQIGYSEDAEVIALKALSFLAGDEGRLGHFMDLTGLSPQAIREHAADPAFLAGVLDHLCADQTLLFLFAESAGLTPENIDRARRSLPGAASDL